MASIEISKEGTAKIHLGQTTQIFIDGNTGTLTVQGLTLTQLSGNLVVEQNITAGGSVHGSNIG